MRREKLTELIFIVHTERKKERERERMQLALKSPRLRPFANQLNDL